MPDWPLPMVQGLKSAARLKEVCDARRVGVIQYPAGGRIDARNDADFCHECCSLTGNRILETEAGSWQCNPALVRLPLRLQIPLIRLRLAHAETDPGRVAFARRRRGRSRRCTPVPSVATE